MRPHTAFLAIPSTRLVRAAILGLGFGTLVVSGCAPRGGDSTIRIGIAADLKRPNMSRVVERQPGGLARLRNQRARLARVERAGHGAIGAERREVPHPRACQGCGDDADEHRDFPRARLRQIADVFRRVMPQLLRVCLRISADGLGMQLSRQVVPWRNGRGSFSTAAE